MAVNDYLYLAPGPVMVPERIMRAVARPVIHQRTAAFYEFFAGFQDNLRYLFQTEYPVLAMAGSGTMGMEVAIRSLFEPGDKVAIPAMGKFSQRWAGFAIQQGLEVIPLGVAWGHTITVDNVRFILDEHPDLKGWVLTHCETSTGVAIDLEEIVSTIRAGSGDPLILADTVSTVGIQPFYMDDWGLDVAVAASQKSLYNPTGTVYVAVSPRASYRFTPFEAEDALHLGHYWDSLRKGTYPFTPPVQLFYGADAALKEIRSKGLPQVWNDIHARSQLFKAGLRQMGVTLYGEGSADALTAFSFGKMDHDELRGRLYEEHGIEVAGGQGHLAGLMMRVGHFGEVSLEDMERCLAAIRQILPNS